MSSLHVSAWLLVKPKKASVEPTSRIYRLTQIVFQKPVLRLQLLARLHRMLDRAQRLQRLQQQTSDLSCEVSSIAVRRASIFSNIENIPRENNTQQESPVYKQDDCFEKLGAEAEHGMRHTSSWRVEPDECSLADEQTMKFILRSPGSKMP